MSILRLPRAQQSKPRRSTNPRAKRKTTTVYQNPKQPTERRVKDLLARMTLQEKADQMMCIWQQKAATLVGETGAFDRPKAMTAFKRRSIGQIGRPSDAAGGLNARQTAELTN